MLQRESLTHCGGLGGGGIPNNKEGEVSYVFDKGFLDIKRFLSALLFDVSAGKRKGTRY
jgi:hypothetical protein